jgi:hypothetical protein
VKCLAGALTSKEVAELFGKFSISVLLENATFQPQTGDTPTKRKEENTQALI